MSLSLVKKLALMMCFGIAVSASASEVYLLPGESNQSTPISFEQHEGALFDSICVDRIKGKSGSCYAKLVFDGQVTQANLQKPASKPSGSPAAQSCALVGGKVMSLYSEDRSARGFCLFEKDMSLVDAWDLHERRTSRKSRK